MKNFYINIFFVFLALLFPLPLFSQTTDLPPPICGTPVPYTDDLTTIRDLTIFGDSRSFQLASGATELPDDPVLPKGYIRGPP